MNQKELRSGMMLVLRHVKPKFIVMSDCFIQGNYYLKAIVSLNPEQTVYSMTDYNVDMTHKTNPSLDIMAVIEPEKIPFSKVCVRNYKTIWQRPDPVDFLTASISYRRIRLSEPANYQTPLNDFQDVEVVLTQLSVMTGATRNSFMLSKWVIEPVLNLIDPVPDPETPIDPEDLPEGGEE